MLEATMLYKVGGVHEIHGGRFDTLIVDAGVEGAVAAAQAAGWHLNTPEATRASEAAQEAALGAKKAVPKASRPLASTWVTAA
jgi:hypothetical protein